MSHFQSQEEFERWIKEKGLAYTGNGEDRVKPVEKGPPLVYEIKVVSELPKPHHSSRKIPKTEQIYMHYLDLHKQNGTILRYWHEPLKFILTHGIPQKVNEMSYKIDFLVQFSDRLRCVEVKANKASEQEDSWVKLKAACELFPCFEFVKAYVNTKTGAITEELLT